MVHVVFVTDRAVIGLLTRGQLCIMKVEGGGGGLSPSVCYSRYEPPCVIGGEAKPAMITCKPARICVTVFAQSCSEQCCTCSCGM